MVSILRAHIYIYIYILSLYIQSIDLVRPYKNALSAYLANNWLLDLDISGEKDESSFVINTALHDDK